jgi:uncharacterized protein
MRFEWNDKKALENLKEHGVTFGEATEVFYDPNAVETEDTQHSVNETRFSIIGYSTRRILFVFRRTESRRNKNHFSATADTKRKESV